MDKIRVCYFLEDRAQEGFVKALVVRVAENEEIESKRLVHDVRSARHGARAHYEFKRFLKDYKQRIALDFDIVVVGIDGNCKGYEERVRQLKRYAAEITGHIVRDRILYAVPDPHIERWYLADQRAFNRAVGPGSAPELPSYKCKKDYYKKILIRALRNANVETLLGGPEYGESIAANLDFRHVEEQNAGFEHFVTDLRRIFRMLREERNQALPVKPV